MKTSSTSRLVSACTVLGVTAHAALIVQEKVDAGADFIITQLFYDVKKYIDYVAACRKAGELSS